MINLLLLFAFTGTERETYHPLMRYLEANKQLMAYSGKSGTFSRLETDFSKKRKKNFLHSNMNTHVFQLSVGMCDKILLLLSLQLHACMSHMGQGSGTFTQYVVHASNIWYNPLEPRIGVYIQICIYPFTDKFYCNISYVTLHVHIFLEAFPPVHIISYDREK